MENWENSYESTGPLCYQVSCDMVRGKCRCHISKICSIPTEHISHGGGEWRFSNLRISRIEIVNGLHHSLDNSFTGIFDDSFQTSRDKTFHIFQTWHIGVKVSKIKFQFQFYMYKSLSTNPNNWLIFCFDIFSILLIEICL